MEARGGPAGPSRPPAMEEWQSDYAKAIPELQSFQSKGKVAFEVVVSRASQMDAGRLDTELTNMLLEQFLKAFALVKPRYLNAFRPELSLLLDFLIFRFSVWRGHPTPGSVLMNLRYRDEASCRPGGGRTGVDGPGLSLRQRVGWGLGFVLSKYLWGRLESIAIAWRWGDQQEGSAEYKSWRVMQWAENAYRLASAVNFLVFLRFGRYRTVLERVLQSRLVYKRASMPKALNFEYLNRQLIWHELSELLLFLLPLINVNRIKALVMKSLPNVYQQGSSSRSGEQQIDTAVRQCNICLRRDMAVPYQALPCQHLFCYYCLRSHTEHKAGFTCPACNTVVGSMQQWHPAD